MESESQLLDASASLGDQPCSTADTQSTFAVDHSLGGAELAAQARAHATRFINLLRTLTGRADVWNREEIPELYRRCHVLEIQFQQQITRGCTMLHNLRADGISDRASLSRAAREQYGMLMQLRSEIMLLRSAREKCNNRLIDMKDPDIVRISSDVQMVQDQIDSLQPDPRASNTGQKEYAHKCYLRSREHLLSRQFQLLEAISHQTPLRAAVMPDMFVDGQTIAEERILRKIQLVLNRIEGAIAHWMVEAQEQKPEAAQPEFDVVEPHPTTATSVTLSSHHLLPAGGLDGQADGGVHLLVSPGTLSSSPIAVEAISTAIPIEISDSNPANGAPGWRFDDVKSWNSADLCLPDIRGFSPQASASAAPYAYWSAIGWSQFADDFPLSSPTLSRPGSPGSQSESWSTPPSEDWLLVKTPADDPVVPERSSDFCLVDSESEGEGGSSLKPASPKFHKQARLPRPDSVPVLHWSRSRTISGDNNTFDVGSPAICEASAPGAENGWGCCDLTDSIHDMTRRPQGFGGLSDVYTASWNSDDGTIKVAIKVVRARGQDQDKILRRLKREVLVWKQLQHPYVLPLYGVYTGMGDFPSLVSPWCENGDICTFIASRAGDPDLLHVKLDLLQQTLDGLHYLHSYNPEIVHGDLKGANVLVSDSYQAQLCDFGFSSMKVDKGSSLVESSAANGTWRWMSPELLSDDNPRHTKASDIWAFGCLLVEVSSC